MSRPPEVGPPTADERIDDLEMQLAQMSDTMEQMKEHIERQEAVLVHLKNKTEALDSDSVEFRALAKRFRG